MKVLIAGYGSIGRRHFKNLLNLGVDDILFYRTHKSSLDDGALSEYIVETELDEALAHNPDAVVVSNPTSLHLDVAIPAARAGCDILLEKPVSHNMERLDEFRAVVAENDVNVLVGFQFRYHPTLKKIKNILSGGRIGKILSLRAHWGEYLPGWHPWEDYRQGYSARKDLGGGVVLTLCHPFDYLRWLIGEIHTVWALTASQSELEVKVEDTAEIGLELSNHVVGSVHLNYTQRPAVHTLDLVGTHGTIQWDDDSGEARVFNTADDAWETFQPPDGFSRNTLFVSEMNQFLDMISKGVEPICTLEDGIRVQEIVEGVKLSAETGRLIKV